MVLAVWCRPPAAPRAVSQRPAFTHNLALYLAPSDESNRKESPPNKTRSPQPAAPMDGMNDGTADGADTSVAGVPSPRMALTPLRPPCEIIYDGSIEMELSPERIPPTLRHSWPVHGPASPEPQRALGAMPRVLSAISIDIIFDDAVRPRPPLNSHAP